jgi:magnesium-transporting ATPase (P-type)
MTFGMFAGLITIIILSILDNLVKRVNPEAKRSGDRQILSYEKPVKMFGWFIFVFLVAMANFMIFRAFLAFKDHQIPLIVWIVSGFIGIIGLALWLEFQFVRIEFDHDYIYTHSPWRKKRIISWNEIITFSYSGINRWYRFESGSNGYVRLSVLLSGIDSFFQEFNKKRVRNNFH